LITQGQIKIASGGDYLPVLMGKGVTVNVLDGAGCIGGNKILLSSGGHSLMLDFGLNYSVYGKYYEGFMAPRTGRGMADYLELGLLPDLNIYRPDLAPGDLDRKGSPALKLDAIWISHAHLDHMGMAGIIERGVPIIAGRTTAALIKGLKDSRMGRDFGTDCPYVICRSPEEKGRSVKAKSKDAAQGRDLYLPEEPGSDFMEFWESIPGEKTLEPGKVRTSDQLDVETKVFDVDHSVYGASALAVKCQESWVVYSGDLRLSGANSELTRDFVAKAKALQPRALIIEGTRAEREGDADVSEKEVAENCNAAVAEEEGCVLADFGPRNFERLDTFLGIAKKNGRRLVITSSDAYFLKALEAAEPRGRLKEVLLFEPVGAQQAAKRSITEELKDQLVDAAALGRRPEEYIICFSQSDLNNLLDIRPKGGSYIYSNSEAFEEEQEFAFERLDNWLSRFGMKEVGFRMVKEGKRMVPEFIKGYHASGHASGNEILRIVEEIAPEIVIPVHTKAPEVFRKLDRIEVVVPERGVPIAI
jgi:ribonuclease J